MSLARDQLIEFCKENKACSRAMDWLLVQDPSKTAVDLWNECPNFTWLWWLVYNAEGEGGPHFEFIRNYWHGRAPGIGAEDHEPLCWLRSYISCQYVEDQMLQRIKERKTT